MFNICKGKNLFVFLMCMVFTAGFLTACGNSSQDTVESTSSIYSESPESEVVLDIPEDFLDFQNYIGEDISLFGMEEGLEEYDGGTSSLYGHKGTVEILVGWDGRTITNAILTFEDKDSFLKEYDEISSKIQELFGEVSFDYDGIKYYSGLTDFNFVISRRHGSVAIAWNDENREIYQDRNPNAGEQSSPKIQNTQVPPAIGMTAAQVRASTWGKPSDINRTTTRYGVSEQWVYNTYSGTKYVYLDDGIVTAIRE